MLGNLGADYKDSELRLQEPDSKEETPLMQQKGQELNH